MPIDIKIKFVPFGQFRYEMWWSASPLEEKSALPAKKVVRYFEPQVTASQIFEVEYKEKPETYIVPLSTG